METAIQVSQRRVRVPPSSARSLLTLDDLQWQGIVGRTPDGDQTATGGSSAYAVGAFAVRYVGGERRLLIPNFKFGPNGETWGDLVEYRAAGSRYAGSDPTKAAALIETGRWAADAWTAAYGQSPAWVTNGNRQQGAKLGTLYWDDRTGLLWYQIYGYYTAENQPFLAAVQLLDTADSVKGAPYRAIGRSSVPFWYRSKNRNEPYWKQVNYFLLPVPADAQANLEGRKFLVGGGTGAVVDVGNLGPGMAAIADLPGFDAVNDVIDGVKIADYSAEAPAPYNARRNPDYAAVDFSDHDMTQYFPPGGLWLGSLDRVVGMTWIETATKHGVLLYGVQGRGRMSYGDNPLSITDQAVQLTHRGATAIGKVSPAQLPFKVGTTIRIRFAPVEAYNGTFVVTAKPTPKTFEYRLPADPAEDGAMAWVQGWDASVLPDLVDPSRQNPEAAHGYLAERFTAQTWVFDPAQIAEVVRGVRRSNNSGINPIELGDWHLQWPNLPYDKQVAVGATQSRWVADNVANRLFWDAKAQELLWLVPQSVSAANPRLTVNVFTVR